MKVDDLQRDLLTSMTLTIQPIDVDFAATVTGVDLRGSISSTDVAAIEAGMDRYAVLVLPNQRITDEQQMAFTLNFGQIEHARGGHIMKDSEHRLQHGMIDVSNLDQHGRTFDPDDRRRIFNLGNRLWHSDSSYRAIPAKYSLLSGRRIATRGGNTEFADMRAAYDALDADMKALVENLVCEHSLLHSLGFTGFSEEEHAMFRPVRQRLVRTHPVTGRKSLFLSSHIGAIVGWRIPEARDLIRDLTEHATQREFVYSHAWRSYDLVMWDNRQTMHRVRRFDENEQSRWQTPPDSQPCEHKLFSLLSNGQNVRGVLRTRCSVGRTLRRCRERSYRAGYACLVFCASGHAAGKCGRRWPRSAGKSGWANSS
jgi:alpha-ketoglutarate-dependent 2,4-dichlorophenoxyacetate dioxygenase